MSSDLIDAIAELRRVTPANDPWDVREFNSIPAPIDDAICVILNAAISGELVVAEPINRPGYIDANGERRPA